MIKGEENCTAAIAAVDFRIVRRSTGKDRCEITMLPPRQGDLFLSIGIFSMPLRAGSVTLPLCFCQ
jgi:hypothetical protein